MRRNGGVLLQAALNLDPDHGPHSHCFLPQTLILIGLLLRLLKQSGIHRWIFDEVAEIRQIDFRFLPKSKPFSYTKQLAPRLFEVPPEHCISAPYLLEEFRPELTEALLDRILDIDNLRVMRSPPTLILPLTVVRALGDAIRSCSR